MDALQEKVAARLDRDELVTMMVDCVRIPSPTGREGPLAEFLAEKYARLGLEVQLQEVEPGRPNVIATLKGSGGGPRFLLSGQMDTRYEPPACNGQLVGDWLAGAGAANMKPCFPTYYMAIKMLLASGADIKGDVIIAGTVGASEKVPVDRYQGAEYRGSGYGARYMVTHGVTADLSAIASMTGLRIQCANMGYVYVRLSTTGEVTNSAYMSGAEDALRNMRHVMDAIERFVPTYARSHRHPMFRPSVAMAAIEGGFPYAPARCPAPFCNLYMRISTAPGECIQDIYVELTEMLGDLKRGDSRLTVDLNFYASANGYQISEDEYLPQAFRRAHQTVFGRDPAQVNPERYSVTTDNIVLFEHGIRGISYGPSGFSRTNPGEYAGYDKELMEVVNIRHLCDGTKVYALALLDVLTKPRAEVLARATTGGEAGADRSRI